MSSQRGGNLLGKIKDLVLGTLQQAGQILDSQWVLSRKFGDIL
jgi:hypothetical protein